MSPVTLQDWSNKICRRKLNISKGNKYKNIKKVCHSGHKHDSKIEADYCDQLSVLKQGRHIQDFRIQEQFRLMVNGVHICDHYVDFLVITKNKSGEVHEVKGMETDVWKIKRKLFEALYPLIPYHVIKKNGKQYT